MKQFFATLLFAFVSFCVFGQRKSTTVKSYYRKDGTFVRSHTRNTNSGSGSSKGNYSYSTRVNSGEPEIFESTLHISTTAKTGGYKKAGDVRVVPTALVADTNGVTILVAVLRYNDTTVLDICPLPRSIVTYDYETSSTSLYFKIPKDKVKPEHTIELVSKYRFDLKDDFLTKSEFLGIGKIYLPEYMTLKVEAITLK